jgi:hypothetical protein
MVTSQVYSGAIISHQIIEKVRNCGLGMFRCTSDWTVLQMEFSLRLRQTIPPLLLAGNLILHHEG